MIDEAFTSIKGLFSRSGSVLRLVIASESEAIHAAAKESWIASSFHSSQ
jgi:hypothetical protein